MPDQVWDIVKVCLVRIMQHLVFVARIKNTIIIFKEQWRLDLAFMAVETLPRRQDILMVSLTCSAYFYYLYRLGYKTPSRGSCSSDVKEITFFNFQGRLNG